MDAQLVTYTGIPTTIIPITPGQNLQLILQNIDRAINNSSAAPNYSTYNLYCVTQVDGTSHPTNTQNFAEGISKILCALQTSYTTFTGTTYVANIATLTTAINTLQTPGVAYAPFNILVGDSYTTVATKLYAGIGTILSAINPSSGNWSTLSITPPTTITGGFNSLISYIVGMNSTISGKQATIGTFNNSTNCLDGTTTDSITTTINLITTYICNLPEFIASSITWYGVASASTLQGAIQNLVNTSSSLLTNAVIQATNSSTLVTAVGGTYGGQQVAVNPTWTGLWKVAANSSDTGDYLVNKIYSSDSSVTIDNSTNPAKINLRVAVPATNEVLVNSSDTTAGYLATKIPSTTGSTWGLGLNSTASGNNSQLLLTPIVSDPVQFVTNILNYISSNPSLLGLYCTLNDQCAGAVCNPPTNLSVSISSANFVLVWTVGAGIVSQMATYRQQGAVDWIATSNFTPANPLSSTATTTTAFT